MCKCLLFWSSFFTPLLWGFSGWAVPVSVEGESLQVGARALAVVEPDAGELWLVVADEGAPLTLPDTATLRSLGIRQVETLDVTGGAGVRLVLARPQFWQASRVEKSFQLSRGGEKGSSPEGLLVLKNRIVLPEAGTALLTASSRETGRRLQLVPSEKVGQYGVPGTYGAVRLLPSLAGMAFEHPSAGVLVGNEVRLPNVLAPVPAVEVEVAQMGEVPPTVAEQPEEELPQKNPVDLKRVYRTGEAIPFVLPDIKNPAQDLPASQSRRRAFAGAFGAVQEAVHSVGSEETGAADASSTSETLAESPDEPRPEKKAIPRSEVFLLELKEERLEDYRTLEARRYEALAAARSGSEKLEAKMDLVRLMIAFRRYEQAEGILRTLPLDKDGMPLFPQARALLGAVLVLQEEGGAALPMLDKMEGVDPHRSVWLAAAQAQVGQYTQASKNFSAGLESVPFYPKQIRTMLQILEGVTLLNTQQYAELFEKMEALALAQDDKEMPDAAKYLVGLASLELGEGERGRKLLSDASYSKDQRLATKAKLSFVMDLARANELSTLQLIRFLEDLRFEWRGDDLEGKILIELGRRYIDQKNFRLGLNRYKTYAVAFPEADNIERVTEEMRRAFLKVFDKKNKEAIDRLGLLGIYFDFRELTPADERGDRVVEDIASELDRVVLYERAADLFERQLEFREEDPLKRAQLGVELSALYRKGNKLEKALETLEKWQTAEMPDDLARDMAVEKARTLLAMDRYKEAQAAVAGWLDDRTRQVQVDVAWAAEDYTTVARFLSQMFDTREHPGMEDVRTRTDFIRLSYALVQLGQREALIQLMENYREDLRGQPRVADVVNVYATQARLTEEHLTFNEPTPLQAIADRMIKLNIFEDQYNARREAIEQIKRRREIFNEKMDYMDFLREQGLL
jgi:hypothetical protein